MLDNNVEKLELENKYTKEYNKLLPIRVDNTITIFHVKYNGKNIKDLTDRIRNKYTIYDTKKQQITLYDDIPLSYGEYDKLPYTNVKVVDKKIIGERNNNSNPILPNVYFPKEFVADAKLSIETEPALASLIENTFLTPDKYVLLDFTELIKYRNHLFNLRNRFVFDKTIDLPNDINKSSKTYKDKIDKFFTINDYRQHLARLAYKLNNDILYLNDREEKKIRTEVFDFLDELQKAFQIEDIAMFPLENLNNTKENETKKILTRFGDRNKDCNYRIFDTKWNGWFGELLDKAESNNDGTKVYNELTKDIVFNYDFDGRRFESKALKSVKETEPYQDMYKELYKIKKAS